MLDRCALTPASEYCRGMRPGRIEPALIDARKKGVVIVRSSRVGNGMVRVASRTGTMNSVLSRLTRCLPRKPVYLRIAQEYGSQRLSHCRIGLQGLGSRNLSRSVASITGHRSSLSGFLSAALALGYRGTPTSAVRTHPPIDPKGLNNTCPSSC